MRRHGPVGSAADLGLHGHACWTYDDDSELNTAELAFLADGVRLGQRLMLVAPGPAHRLRPRLDGLEDADGLIERGALAILPLESIQRPGQRTDPDHLLALYGGATEKALADGFTGLRVAADVTELVRDPANWDAHVRWESIADRYMARMPLAALCSYDRRVLPDAIVADLAAVHAASHGPETPFRLVGIPDGLALEGSVDYFSARDFERVLALAIPAEPTMLDLGELEFIDHHGVEALETFSDRIDIRRAPAHVERTSKLLGLDL